MSERILVVEDSPTQAEALGLLLQEQGYSATMAASGEEALELLAAHEFDLVLTDIVMPGISGYELCGRIKAEPAWRERPVILLTALRDPLDIVRGLACEADNYIMKPFEPHQLILRVRHVLANRVLRPRAKAGIAVQVNFLGNSFTITSEREQILDLLISSFEDVVRANGRLEASETALREAQAQLEAYARQLERRARVSARKYWTLMQHASEAILVLDAAGRILEANARAGELLASPLEALSAQRLEAFVAPDDLEYFRVQLAKLPESRSAEANDLNVVRADGRRVRCDFSASVTRGDGDELVLAMLRDATDRVARERQTIQLERLATMGMLTAGIVHEISNPISFLATSLDRILECAERLVAAEDPRLATEAREVLGTAREMRQATAQIVHVVRYLKTFARADEEDLAEVDVNECAESAAVIAWNEIKYRATLEKDYAELPRIVASRSRLQQVLVNLLVNAAHAVEEGGPERNRIRLETRLEGEWLHVSVADNGRGIPPDVRERLFEPFFTTKPAGTGTGLGLYVTRQIVASYGGEIEVESELGRGATFTVRLPRQTGRRLPAPREAPEPAARSRLKVLLVDDEAYVLKAYERALGRGHDVTAALGGRQAIEILSRSGTQFDAIVSDLLMPDVDGIDLHAYLSEQHPMLAGRTIFMTGGAATLRAREFLASLATPWLEKPFEMDELLRLLAEVAGDGGV
ncbi:MAG: response regulator [Gemmatimonadetes bacterium]|nr:response regulator [Gemmatimonadota bacterium]